MAMRQTKGLYKSLIGTEEQPNELAPLANGVSIDNYIFCTDFCTEFLRR